MLDGGVGVQKEQHAGKAMLAQVRPQGTTSPSTVSWPLHWQLLTHILPWGGGRDLGFFGPLFLLQGLS